MKVAAPTLILRITVAGSAAECPTKRPADELVEVTGVNREQAQLAGIVTCRIVTGNPAWPVALETMSRLNRRRWQRGSGADSYEQSLLLDLLEQMLSEWLEHETAANKCTGRPVAAAQVLTNDGSDVAVYM